jgi:hypothetical protein
VQNFLKVCDGLDTQALAAALRDAPELWDQNPGRRTANYVHSDMKDIWVRFNRIEVLNERPAQFCDEHVPVWYPAYQQLKAAIDPILFRLMAVTEGEMLGGVLISKLTPGGKIAPHVDGMWHALYYSKFWVPIQNDEGAKFLFEGEPIPAKVGDAWQFNNQAAHAVDNDSTRDRLSLIVCIRSQKYPNFGAVT